MMGNIILLKKEDAPKELVAFAEEKLCTHAVSKIPEEIFENTVSEAFYEAETLKSTPVLSIDSDGISLEIDNQKIRGDFTKEINRINNPSRLNAELLIKASKLKSKPGDILTALDATAGLGEDSLLLAAYGYKVTMFERDPVIGLLLFDALRRAGGIPALKEISSRMELRFENSIEFMNHMEKTSKTSPDIILLDPMFPERKKSGLIKKKFQVLHSLEKPCDDEKELLEAARHCHPKRIIIKRPAKGPYLAGEKPSYFIKGDAIRYDCITLF